MTHEVTDRHPAQALRRCATTPEDSLSASLPENEGMSAERTRFQLTPDRVRGITPAQHAPQRGAAVYGWKRKKPVNPTSSVS